MKITLLGKPIAKMRARYSKRGDYVITYDPQQAAKESVRARLMEAMREYFDGEEAKEAPNLARSKVFQVEFWFYLPFNESDSQSQKNAKLWGLEPAICKPDYDNLEKFYLDCANGILFPDDRMIIDASAHKRYGDPARVEITIMAKEELNLHPKAEGILKVFGPADVEEFITHVKTIAHWYCEPTKDNIECNKEYWLTSTACLLSDFVEKWGDKLNKIKKYAGLSNDLRHTEQCKAAYIYDRLRTEQNNS